MNRRSFIARFVGGIASLAIARTAFKETFKHPKELGFTLIQDPFPPRFVMSNGQWEQVETWTKFSSSMAINPAWVNAPLEMEVWELNEDFSAAMKERA